MRGFEGRAARRAFALLPVLILLSAGFVPASPLEDEASSAAWPRVSLSGTGASNILRWALVGASRRLSGAQCQAVYSDFRDLAGRALTERLAELGETETGYLRLILFRDGSNDKRCGREGLAAFTAAGNRVVYICERQFGRIWRQNPKLAEVILIHEALHTLGLGENPPSSLEITRHVIRRCSR